MKRLSLVLILLILLFPLAARSLIFDLVMEGLDFAFAFNKPYKVSLNGESVVIGGSNFRNLKKTLSNHDFSILSFDERLNLYDAVKLPIGRAVSRNLLIGFGKGSLAQGDKGGQLFGLIGDYLSLGFVAFGSTALLIDALSIYLFSSIGNSNADFWDREDEFRDLSVAALKIGAIAFGVSRLIQIILPINYGLKYNKTLRNSFGLSKKREDLFDFEVGFIPNNWGELSFRVASTISY